MRKDDDAETVGVTPDDDAPTVAPATGTDDTARTVGLTPAEADAKVQAAAVGQGDQVEGFRLIRLVGEGGMGEVWEAEQLGSLKRRVALKLIKPGMDTREVIARFEAERQTLAQMEHAGVARVFDAGQTRLGRPYFAMEFVEGKTLDKYCDDEHLTIDERLLLFEQICAAIHHAHQKGVIHRDLKPSNVLVTEDDGKAQPKIIDFGIATAADPDSRDQAALTTVGQFVGTLLYMSPEQIDTGAAAVDTRADIYSLGVILYELICGHWPFSGKRLQEASLVEIQQMLREEVPQAPSRRLARAQDRATMATRRGTDVSHLAGKLRGDLDWIVLKALEKEPSRRYDSAAALADDVARHRSFKPVRASPPSGAYRARKFVRRHRLGVAAAAMVSVAVVAGATLAVMGMVRAQRAEATATREAVTAQRVTSLMVDLFRVADPSETRGNTVTAREILDRGAAGVQAELEQEPEIRATLLTAMGRAYTNLGLYDSAIPLLENALSTRAALYGEDTEPAAESSFYLGEAAFRAGDYDRAQGLYRDAIAVRTQAHGGPDDLGVADARRQLASTLWRQGILEEAESVADQALASYQASDLDLPGRGQTLLTLGNIYFSRGQHAEAEQAYRQAADALVPLLGELDVTVANARTNTGVALWLEGRPEEGLPYVQAGYETMRELLGDEHPLVANTLHGYAVVLHAAGRLEEAEAAYARTLALFDQFLGDRHPDVAAVNLSLARIANEYGRYQEGEQLIRSSIDIYEEALPEGHWRMGVCLATLGVSLVGQERFSEARTLLEENVETVLTSQPQSPHAREVLTAMVRLYDQLGDQEAAAAARARLVENGGQAE